MRPLPSTTLNLPEQATKHRILVIDDNPAIHEDFCKILSRAAPEIDGLNGEEALLFGASNVKPDDQPTCFEIDCALQGQQGFELLRQSLLDQRPYALAFVDVRMPPGWDGIETVTRLWDLYPDLQVVICTAYSDYSWNDITQRFGHSDSMLILKKPFDALAVLQMAHAMIKKWLLAQQAKSQLLNLNRTVEDLQLANRMLTREMAERIEAEKQLRLSEERFAKAFNSSPVPMSIQSLDNYRYLDVNASYLEMTGYQRDDLIGKNPLELNLWPDCAGRKLLFDQLTDGKSLRNIESKIRGKDGREKTTLLSAEVTMLGTEWFALISEHDLSQRLELESQLRQAQKMEAIGQLAAGVAHDFNNLLTIIQGNVSLLLMEPNLDARIHAPLKDALSASERAGNLTRQLLAFSRKQVIELQPVKVSTLFDQLGRLLPRLIGEQIQVEFSCPAELPPIHADPCSVEQIIMNLAVNARDAMPQGGQLRFSAAAVRVPAGRAETNAQASAGFVCLTVKDTGCGMDESTKTRIFEPFFTTKPAGKGTGMGLATVYGIVKQHKGWIELDSAVGVGTTFRVYLPVSLQSTDTAHIAKPELAPFPCTGTETILVVEDEEFVRQFVQTLLESNGYTVLLAADAAHALKLWQHKSSDISLLLTDMIMPGGVTGRELARQLSLDKPDLKVIFTSGYTLDVLGDNSDRGSGYSFLQKPYQAQVLAATVRRCLDGHCLANVTRHHRPALAATL